MCTGAAEGGGYFGFNVSVQYTSEVKVSLCIACSPLIDLPRYECHGGVVSRR